MSNRLTPSRRRLLALAVLMVRFGAGIATAQELRLETPAERADAKNSTAARADERSPRSDNEGPKVLGGWSASGVWLEPNRHAYYPTKGLVLDKITGRWFKPIRRSSNWRPTNPYNVRNEIASNCTPCTPRQPTTVSPCSPTLAPSLPTYQPSYNRPTYTPPPVYTPHPVYIPPTYPIRTPYPEYRPYYLQQGLRLGGSLEREWKPSRTPVGWLVK